ncbi:MAG: hypothetical protein CL460_02205 [Acidimicrobiaceae bacterium]|nr:hypothetical protein [Acidimicrobiaceae bacterium]
MPSASMRARAAIWLHDRDANKDRGSPSVVLEFSISIVGLDASTWLLLSFAGLLKAEPHKQSYRWLIAKVRWHTDTSVRRNDYRSFGKLCFKVQSVTT